MRSILILSGGLGCRLQVEGLEFKKLEVGDLSWPQPLLSVAEVAQLNGC